MPHLWNTCIVPVPKERCPHAPRDYRPTRVMKTFERLVLHQVRIQLNVSLQFTYQQHIGVEDLIIFLTHKALSHLERQGSTGRVMFFNFSSAFNTIQPCLLKDMLLHPNTTAWILDYFTGRPQYVRMGSCVSEVVMISTEVGFMPPSEVLRRPGFPWS